VRQQVSKSPLEVTPYIGDLNSADTKKAIATPNRDRLCSDAYLDVEELGNVFESLWMDSQGTLIF
jgi:hypothetical protein